MGRQSLLSDVVVGTAGAKKPCARFDQEIFPGDDDGAGVDVPELSKVCAERPLRLAADLGFWIADCEHGETHVTLPVIFSQLARVVRVLKLDATDVLVTSLFLSRAYQRFRKHSDDPDVQAYLEATGPCQRVLHAVYASQIVMHDAPLCSTYWVRLSGQPSRTFIDLCVQFSVLIDFDLAVTPRLLQTCYLQLTQCVEPLAEAAYQAVAASRSSSSSSPSQSPSQPSSPSSGNGCHEQAGKDRDRRCPPHPVPRAGKAA